jgi:hypothetical protein
MTDFETFNLCITASASDPFLSQDVSRELSRPEIRSRLTNFGRFGSVVRTHPVCEPCKRDIFRACRTEQVRSFFAPVGLEQHNGQLFDVVELQEMLTQSHRVVYPRSDCGDCRVGDGFDLGSIFRVSDLGDVFVKLDH